jgi:nitrite reductase/ring-hydroxylating ferredoxin subunit
MTSVISERCGRLEDLAPGTMRLAKVAGRQILLVRTTSGVQALDNACPHQGYGLATGTLVLTPDAAGNPGADGLVTCLWHNWKFRTSDGECVLGEEAVASHAVRIEDGEIIVEVRDPDAATRRAALWPSLRNGIERDYSGQIARDTVRLLANEATPAEIIAVALQVGAPRADYGVGHETAVAADCLAVAESRTDTDRVLPLVQALTGISETTRDRPARVVPAPRRDIEIAEAIASEDVDAAMAAVAGALITATPLAAIRSQFIHAASSHHFDYGHGAIYTQKVFEVLERIGEQHAIDVLPHLAASLAFGTREDSLPYMRKAQRLVESADLVAMAASPDRRDTGWKPDALVAALIADDEAPINTCVDAVLDGAGVEGLLDAVALAASHRLLRHDLDVEFDHSEPFGWLDITHALTYANAARWAWRVDPGPHTARLALYTAWLAHDSGRNERRRGVAAAELEATRPVAIVATEPDQIRKAVQRFDYDRAAGLALGGTIDDVTDQLTRAAFDDRSGAFIVVAHLIKTALAAGQEAAATGSMLPLAGAARFIAAPRIERFIAAAVHESIDFVTTGRPPRR